MAFSFPFSIQFQFNHNAWLICIIFQFSKYFVFYILVEIRPAVVRYAKNPNNLNAYA